MLFSSALGRLFATNIGWDVTPDLLKWEKIPNFAGYDDDGNYEINYPSANVNTIYGFVEGKHELLPIPLTELNVNPNISQNPNW